MVDIRVKRIYDEPDEEDGLRVLVDRLWPRGLSREKARVDAWIRGIAPSSELRKWYGHDADKWPEFRRRYLQELRDAGNGDIEALKGSLAEHERVTLLFSSRERERNNAVALKEFLEQGLV